MNMRNHCLKLFTIFFVISIFQSCIDKTEFEFQKYMKENFPNDVKITEIHSDDKIENEAVKATIHYLKETNEFPNEYYVFLFSKETDSIITISIEHISGYKVYYYWEKERKQMCPIVGNISGKGKTITWDSKIKKIISVGSIQ